MEGDRFDQLSRLLGRGVDRRAAVVALAALAASGVGEATAKSKPTRHQRAGGGNGHGGPGGNRDCAHFCAAVFGADTPEAGRCTSAAAQGTGLCYQCGPRCGAACDQTLCGTTCIPTSGCCTDAECTPPQTCGGATPHVCGEPGGRVCVPNDQVCSIFGLRCCGDPRVTFCAATAGILVTTCQTPCTGRPADFCQQTLGYPDVQCVEDRFACTDSPGHRCCRPNVCGGNGDCKGGGRCCFTLAGVSRCCAPGQVCAPGGGCATA